MEQEKEKRNRQQMYLTVMALMKEMRSEGIIDKDDLLKVEAVFSEQFKPIWRYKDYELKLRLTFITVFRRAIIQLTPSYTSRYIPLLFFASLYRRVE